MYSENQLISNVWTNITIILSADFDLRNVDVTTKLVRKNVNNTEIE
jgi:hypothetical protein